MVKQELTPKEASLFRQIFKLYETKQYKKSLKNADQILKKYPEHGETLSMKGLILTLLNKKSEGYEHAHRGLRNNLTSHICWHVFGLLHRLDKNYNEAIKCYINALKYDKENLQILRDLALLQTHKRLFTQLVNTRNILLQLNPKQRQNWIAYALANYLNGNIVASEKILTTYENISKNDFLGNYENSEAVLYKCTIIMELGNYIEALNYINSLEYKVVDKMSIMEIKAKCLLKLQKKEAIAEYIKLLDRNSENSEYYIDLARAKGLKNKNEVIDTNGLKQMYIDLEKRYPGSYVAKCLLLDFLSGDEFKTAINSYLEKLFEKGTPSIFISIKCLYSDKEKKDIIQNLVEEYLDNLYLKKDILCGIKNGTKNNDPTVLLWILYFLAQHYDYLRETEKALIYIDKAIEHTPTLVELYLTKARIYKHSGNAQLAMFFLNNARKLDLQDRYINTKCAKYMLRNDCNKEALNIIGLFTKTNIIDGPIDDLVDMQCIWFILEDGQSFLRQKKYNIALKRFETIRKIFNIWNEDQFDFHSYSLKKGTFRTYIDCLKWEDNLFLHPYYLKAAQLAIKIYVLLHDHPDLKNNLNYTDSNVFNNKETLKQAENIQLQNNNLNNKKSKENEKLDFDDDPNGNKLIQTENPLQDALRFLLPLQSLTLDNIQIYILGFEIYFRQKNYSQALKCILNAKKLDLYHPDLHLQMIYLKKNFKNILESQDAEEIIQKKNEIFSTDITEYDLNEEFYKYTKNFSAYHVLSYIKSLVLINELSHLEEAIVQLLSFNDITVFREAFDIITEDRLKSLFKKLILEKFPLATGFD
ncbi:hypothetical protein T552_03406 [Pneumocystis carinii B80]|uniref:Uncharacterized protein n=1 Tax=Pneumocystis carinii (strain B80) TaxID=1408658 RepID=A0A0W4ZC03_PNEC8|nr:hypothetical protein T552_03406 [Pneumocystis carinii B80]KTW25793.1 hypothetical protein T552_03406 [Pneumocystis carinii B80]